MRALVILRAAQLEQQGECCIYIDMSFKKYSSHRSRASRAYPLFQFLRFLRHVHVAVFDRNVLLGRSLVRPSASVRIGINRRGRATYLQVCL